MLLTLKLLKAPGFIYTRGFVIITLPHIRADVWHTYTSRIPDYSHITLWWPLDCTRDEGS